MRQRHRTVGALVIAGIGVGVLGACAPGEHFTDDSVRSERITAVRLDSSAGSVVVRGTEGATRVSVHRSVDYEADRPGETARVEGGVLVLGGCGRGCSVSYTVEVPAGLPIDGRTTDGSVRLSRVGAVNVSTESGSVTLDDVAGPTEVRTTDGSISGRGLNGDRIRAQTGNGRIELSPAEAQDVTAKTSNGAITLTVPPASYRVSASTDNGRKDIGVAADADGRFRLDLSTSNGAITVRTG
ncbi:DUF4097 family beta strand repeat-containing protein [Kitasatospora sp. NPDC003701]